MSGGPGTQARDASTSALVGFEIHCRLDLSWAGNSQRTIEYVIINSEKVLIKKKKKKKKKKGGGHFGLCLFLTTMSYHAGLRVIKWIELSQAAFHTLRSPGLGQNWLRGAGTSLARGSKVFVNF